MKKIVVSALFNGHDYLKDPVLDGYNPEWDYILFTDDEYLQSDYWQIIPMQGSRESARSLKIKTHKHLKFDVCLWVDASMVLKVNPDDILTELADNDFLFKVHPERETTYQEIKACAKFGRLHPSECEMLEMMFDGMGYTHKIQDSQMLYETGLYIKRNTSSTIEFCEEWYKLTVDCLYRDQVALPYIVYKNKPLMDIFDEGKYLAWVNYSKHNDNLNLPEIHYFQPFALDGNLGQRYNDVADYYDLDGEEWICIMDQDICFLDSRLKLWIAKTIAANYQDYDVFTCMTNRLADSQQVVQKLNVATDIRHHKMQTLKQWEQYTTSVKAATHPTAGLLMIMQVKTLKAVKFKNGLMYIDTDFYLRAVADGFRFGIMRGIYLFHYYRLLESKNSISHLQRMHFK